MINSEEQTMYVTKRDGTVEERDIGKIQKCCEWATEGLLGVSQSELETDSHIIITDRMSTSDIQTCLIVTAARKISKTNPNWTYVAARLLMQRLYKNATKGTINYVSLSDYVENAIQEGRIDSYLGNSGVSFDFDVLESALKPERDLQFDYLGLSTIASRYLIKNKEGIVIELPQHFFMRVAMGIAKCETTKEKRTQSAVYYYNNYSTFSAMPSTPTLFNSGTNWPQLSSCFISKCGDSVEGIMEFMTENALYSKFAGGCSGSFTSIRSEGSLIKSTGGKAGGPVPYIKIFNDILNGFDQSGKRKGSGAVYLEPWHSDIYQFLDLRQPGDDRLRAHDVFPALWIPDLFMERVLAKETWSLFDPATAVGLADTYGTEFEELYTFYENQKAYVRQVPAEDLWRKIISRLFEEGVYWPNFKDTFNSRYAQPELIRSSNLCTEIGLRTSDENSSVCNLHSVNVGHKKHLLQRNYSKESGFDWNTELELTVRRTTRALDSVITVSTVPHEKGRSTNSEDRPIGLGIMGYTVALQILGIDYESAEQVVYSNEMMRQISLTAIDESANMAQELGCYPSFERSTWANGELPIDSASKLSIVKEYDLYTECDTPWASAEEMRNKVALGMRNSTVTAIAPTASISNIIQTTPCAELPYQEEFEKENLNGQFMTVAPTLLNNPLETEVKTVRNVDQIWTVRSAAARQLWICQSQSTNIFITENTDGDGKAISNIYFEGWRLGLKSFYYLRGLAIDSNTKPADTEQSQYMKEPPTRTEESEGAFCTMRPGDKGFTECEVCQ
jgi:ribonucleoside-diphosphate reductase alpha chain